MVKIRCYHCGKDVEHNKAKELYDDLGLTTHLYCFKCSDSILKDRYGKKLSYY